MHYFYCNWLNVTVNSAIMYASLQEKGSIYAYPVHLKVSSNNNSTTLTLIVPVVVVLCAAVIVITIILSILRRYMQHKNRKNHLNVIVAELEHINLIYKLSNSGKSIQLSIIQ